MKFITLTCFDAPQFSHASRVRSTANPIAFGHAIIASQAAFSGYGIACAPVLTALFSTMYRAGKFTLILHTDAITFTFGIANFREIDAARVGTDLFFGAPRFANIGNGIFQIDTFAILALLVRFAFVIAGIRRLGVWFLIIRIGNALSGIIANLPRFALTCFAIVIAGT